MRDLPEILARHEHDGQLRVELRVPADSPWFEGHFPGHPILPGVVQIGWAATLASAWIGSDVPPVRLTRIKFKHPLGPGARLSLVLYRKDERVVFEYQVEAAEGTISASSGAFTWPAATA